MLGFGLLVFMIASLINRHFQRDLRVRAKEVAPQHLIDDAVAHAQFDFHNHDDPAAYNTLQKLSYVVTIFVLIPLMILTGLAMSPAMDAAWPWLLDIFGGRQSARSIHFIAAAGLVGFIIIHLALVILAGPVGEVMSMITGRWKLPEAPAAARPNRGARRMTLITRRGLVTGGAVGAGLLLSGCDQLGTPAGFPQDPVLGRQDQPRAAARAQRPRRARPRISPRPDVADLPRQRHARSQHARLQQPCRDTLRRLAACRSAGWSTARCR